ncbi:MAG: stage II sporulation protein M [Candidatus Aenigmarchaeota archaeon]|nr:stage II sporulation protein M [Candidatus Aenigmarchaeota archaeon]
MLESILSFKEVEKSPYLTFIWALLITTIAVILSTQVSYKVQISNVTFNLAGIFAVIFTIVPSVYFFTTVIKKEEQIEETEILKRCNKGFLCRHGMDMLIFFFYFFGVTFAFAIWAFVLPADFFQVQLMKVHEIRAALSGQVTGEIVKGSFNSFLAVFYNNIQVMAFAFLFSLLFGAGAIFIIVWNASVLGSYIGELSKAIYEIPKVSFFFLPHGIPEVIGYLLAGLAGGLISAAVLRSRSGDVLKIIIIDSMKILALGAISILAAAFIEIYL